MEDIKIAPIRNGTVIDHIKAGQALNVLKIIGIDETSINSTISVAMHVKSMKGIEWKDVVKVEDIELDKETVDKIGLISPNASIVIIRDFYVAEKYKVNVGEHVVGLVKCDNPNCITNKGEPVTPEFDVISNDPPVLRCMYCERCISNISKNLL